MEGTQAGEPEVAAGLFEAGPAACRLAGPGEPADVFLDGQYVQSPKGSQWRGLLISHELGHVRLLPRDSTLADRLLLALGHGVLPSQAPLVLNLFCDLLINAVLAGRGHDVATFYRNSPLLANAASSNLSRVFLAVFGLLTRESDLVELVGQDRELRQVVAGAARAVRSVLSGRRNEIRCTAGVCEFARLLQPLLATEEAADAAVRLHGGGGEAEEKWRGLVRRTADLERAAELGKEALARCPATSCEAGTPADWLERAAARAAPRPTGVRTTPLRDLQDARRGVHEDAGRLERGGRGAEKLHDLASIASAPGEQVSEALADQRARELERRLREVPVDEERLRAGDALQRLQRRASEPGSRAAVARALEQALHEAGGFSQPTAGASIAGFLGVGDGQTAAVWHYRARLALEVSLEASALESGAVTVPGLWHIDWQPADSCGLLDVAASLGRAGRLLPGISMLRREELPVCPLDRRGPHPGCPALEIFLDSSGSMPNPLETTSPVVVAAMMVARAALRGGAPVRVVNFSGYKQVRDTGWSQDLDVLDSVLCHFFGSGTVLPFELLASGTREGPDRRFVLLATDAEIANGDQLLHGLAEALELAVPEGQRRTTGWAIFLHGAQNALVEQLQAQGAKVYPAVPEVLSGVVLGINRKHYRTM
ncbi:MAG: hypothetical protein HY814_08115 [Candidatus Riflebacteria bacterium]|nr:hypothetical protein [Candidatus Riflebacteria bacterium]